MTVAVVFLAIACDGSKSIDGETPGTPTWPTADAGSADGGSADGGSADGGSADGGHTDGGSTTPLPELPSATCPPPPDDAIVFHAGTVVVDQIYVHRVNATPEILNDKGDQIGWHLITTGLSYTHDTACDELAWGNRIFDDIKAGGAPGQYWFEFSLFLPGLEHKGWLGEHALGHEGPYLGPNNPGHTLRIGWRDAKASYPSMVSSLPYGWTETSVCVGYISPDYLYLTVLWDPKDGPYTTNDFVRIDQPIWFDMEIWPTGGSDPADPEGSKHRSCALTDQAFLTDPPVADLDELFAGYTWKGKDFP